MKSVLAMTAVATAWAICPTAIRAQDTSYADPAQQVEIELLIQQLGASEFSQREIATARLIEIGLPALHALEEAWQNPDREIRGRCNTILALVRAERRRRQLAAFLGGEDSASDEQLPGWPRFREIVGDDKPGRSLFAEMLRLEWPLLEQWQQNPLETAEPLIERCIEIQQSASVLRQPVKFASVAAVLLVASDPRVNIPDQMGSQIFGLCNLIPPTTGSSNDADDSPYEKLLGAWIIRGDGTWTTYQSLLLALRRDLKEGLALAEKVLRDENQPVNSKQYAVLTVGKLGNKEKHLKLLEPLLQDHSVCSQKTKRTLEVQLRDVALAAIVHLAGMNPKEFGFKRLQSNTAYLFVPNSMGFGDDQEREQSIKKWESLSRNE